MQTHARPSPRRETGSPGTPDVDEAQDWRDALDALLAAWGPEQGPPRARAVLDALLAHASSRGVDWHPAGQAPDSRASGQAASGAGDAAPAQDKDGKEVADLSAWLPLASN
ncbi:hypothetical protein ISE1_0945 [plant metagenome]|uniref:Uncharacterized protein n=1 Tax=plant metagenome TaxID=1297885 RepID=A0A484TSK2_9ZZZZ